MINQIYLSALSHALCFNSKPNFLATGSTHQFFWPNALFPSKLKTTTTTTRTKATPALHREEGDGLATDELTAGREDGTRAGAEAAGLRVLRAAGNIPSSPFHLY